MLGEIWQRTQTSRKKVRVCIIGAGAAGMFMAEKLGRAGARVLLIESGSKRPTRASEILNQAAVVGLPYDLASSRSRAFGGTLHIWGRRCTTLDQIDFVEREWVAESGWPLTALDLAPHYQEALKFLGVGEACHQNEEQLWMYDPLVEAASDCLTEKSFLLLDDANEAFCTRHRKKLLAIPNVTLLEDHLVTSLDRNEAGRVSAVRVVFMRSPEVRHTIEADIFILCAGAIEIPRLLLASRSGGGAALGNRRDLVGRYFMDHPRLRSLTFRLSTSGREVQERILRAAALGMEIGYRVNEAEQDRHGFLNHSFVIEPLNASMQPMFDQMMKRVPFARAMQRCGTESAIRQWWRRHPALRRQVNGALHAVNTNRFAFRFMLECAPNRDSRILLNDRSDRFGMPALQIDWRLVPDTAVKLRRYFAYVERWMNTSGLIEEKVVLPEPENLENYSQSSHPMGTTRMSSDPSRGVVDPQLRLFDSPNVFICSSSVFPTAGNAHPTLTILALASRLSIQLIGNLKLH